MKKLTQKEYVEDLETCSHFIGAYHNYGLEWILEQIKELTYEEVKAHSKYQYTTVEKRSKDFVFTKKNGDKVYRDFIGKNKYFTHKQILYHINTQDGHECVFINL